jgi:hypothetical protein
MDTEKQLFVFRILEISSRSNRSVPSQYCLGLNSLAFEQVLGAAPAKLAFDMRTAFNNVNERRVCNARARLIEAQANFRLL